MPPQPSLLDDRLARLRRALVAAGCESLVVAHGPNRHYLTGVPSSSGVVLVTPDHVYCATDGRYAEAMQAAIDPRQDWSVVVVPNGTSLDEWLTEQMAARGCRTLGIEAEHVSIRRFRWLETRLGEVWPAGVLVPTDGLVEALRTCKDTWELGRLREAAGRVSEIAKRLLVSNLAGQSERAIAAQVDAHIRAAGFDRPAFDTIVASGPHAARPHHRAADRVVEPGDLVVVDFGGVLDGYAADLTRTVAVGRVSATRQRWVDAVAAAQAAAVSAVAAGVVPSVVDGAARQVLAAYQLEHWFTHATGHGLGLEVHERPRIGPSRVGEPESVLAPGMVFTVEPGVYVPSEGGVRIEDDIVLTPDGPERLTVCPHM